MNISGRLVTLRAIDETDLPKLREWANDVSIQRMLGGWHFPVGMQDQERWFQSLRFDSLNQRFAIDVPAVGLIGTANLVSVDWQNRTAFHGLLIGREDMRGRGYALDAVMALMRFAFEEMGLHRLDTDIIEYNAASLRFYTGKCGWKIEGKRKGWYFRNGSRWDKVIVGIDVDAYNENLMTSKYWS